MGFRGANEGGTSRLVSYIYNNVHSLVGCNDCPGEHPILVLAVADPTRTLGLSPKVKIPALSTVRPFCSKPRRASRNSTGV
jgi:hypothetical protein